MKQYLFIILIVLISGCCSYDQKDFDFSKEELNHFSVYNIGDTIYFESNLGDMDTITIVDFKTEKHENCGGFIAPKPVNGKWISIKHLPVDQWHGTSQDMAKNGKIETDYATLFWISKFPTDTETTYNIEFKDFYTAPDTTIGEFHADTITLNDLKISQYYLVKHGYPERITEPQNIATVYWTDQYGLMAYKSKAGEIWTIRK
ncbi:MAG: hypothetical protein V4620_02570 [Bacteroidota bacterium]